MSEPTIDEMLTGWIRFRKTGYGPGDYKVHLWQMPSAPFSNSTEIQAG